MRRLRDAGAIVFVDVLQAGGEYGETIRAGGLSQRCKPGDEESICVERFDAEHAREQIRTTIAREHEVFRGERRLTDGAGEDDLHQRERP